MTDPLRESDRQSSESRDLETASAVSVEDGLLLAYRKYADSSSRFTHGERSEDMLLQRIWNLAGDVRKLLDLLASTTAALPPPKSSSGLGSASALEVEGRELGALRRQLLDAMSAWSEDNYAAGWISGLDRMLCKRGGIWEIIGSVTGWPLGYEADCGWVTWGEARTHYGLPASATKPEASPSPESQDLGDEQSSSCGGTS